MKSGDYIDNLKAALEGARAALGRANLRMEELERERDEARANARILASSYDHDSRPPTRAVDDSLAYPAIPERFRDRSSAPTRSGRKNADLVIERKKS